MSDGLGEVILYEAPDGEVHLEVRLDRDTVWLSQEQMAALFDVQKAAVSKHLKNIFASGELERAATVSKMETVQHEGARRVSRQIEHFNLDAVISVGYRVNSARAAFPPVGHPSTARAPRPGLYAESPALRAKRPRVGDSAGTRAQGRGRGGVDQRSGPRLGRTHRPLYPDPIEYSHAWPPRRARTG